MADLLPPPEDVAWPRHMTAIHPRAVGSLGVAAQAWIETALGIRLRWWQALAIRRQLEIDADGLLVWFTVVESAPRRSGKSTRLRGSALWRSVQGAAFGEPQTTLLTGKDLPVVREVHRRAWPWAEANGCSVRKQNGNEEIEWPDLSRWLVRSVFAVYGYDVGYGMVDEGWGVSPTAVDDGLEPALLERAQPQLLLTSTGHPKATPMMTTRRDAALDQLDDPTDTLLLDWGAPPGCEIGDRRAWRLASPYWSAARERLLESALRRILAGHDEVSGFEGLDPETSFRAQYLNEWPRRGARVLHWLPPEAVARCGADEVTLSGAPLVGAIEVALDGSQWSAAVSDGRSCQTLVGATLPAAVEWLNGHAPHEVVANSAAAKRLPNDWLPIHHVTVGEISAATQTLKDAISADSIRWDNPADLEAQFARVVTAPGPAGPKIADRVSRGNVEAVYALSWAYFRVVTEQPQLPMIF